MGSGQSAEIRFIDCESALDLTPVQRVARVPAKGYLYGSRRAQMCGFARACSAGDESLIARLQTLQRLVRRRCGIGIGFMPRESALRSFQVRHGGVPLAAFEDGRVTAAAHDRLIGDDDGGPRRDRAIDLRRKLRVHAQARRDFLCVGTVAAAGHTRPAARLAGRNQRAHAAGRPFEQREHMIAERPASADLHRSARPIGLPLR
jgi:hypothetical protein